jgi:hypothetical protein
MNFSVMVGHLSFFFFISKKNNLIVAVSRFREFRKVMNATFFRAFFVLFSNFFRKVLNAFRTFSKSYECNFFELFRKVMNATFFELFRTFSSFFSKSHECNFFLFSRNCAKDGMHRPLVRRATMPTVTTAVTRPTTVTQMYVYKCNRGSERAQDPIPRSRVTMPAL